MKQHIKIDQLNELNHIQRGRLQEWWDKTPYSAEDGEIPLLSIGQMIEFLQNSGRCWWTIRKEEINAFAGEMPDGYEGSYSVYMDEKTTGMTLCDALWQAVKHELSGVGE